MNKILYLGYVVSPEEANQMSGASVAGNKMQWNVLKNLNSIEGLAVKSITVTPLAVFPKEKQLWQKKQVKELACGVKSICVPYFNFPIIKQLWQIVSVYRTAKKQIKDTGAKTLLCFNLFPQVGIPMRWLKKKFPELDTVCLLADLPLDERTDRKGFSAWIRKKFYYSTWRNMEKCDRFITLNHYVAQTYLPGKPYIMIDGGVDDDVIAQYQVPVEKSKEKNILFSGALTEYNGIMPLIQAMDQIEDQSIYLDIYGSGYLDENVRMAAKQNSHIRYHGRVANDTVLQRQREAWLLMNPRKVDDIISKVTFPSKTFEYLLSGTPVLTTPLATYGPEYKGYMLFTNGDDVKALADGINKVNQMDAMQLQNLAKAAQSFVAQEKSWKKQCQKIAGFLQEANEQGQVLSGTSVSKGE